MIVHVGFAISQVDEAEAEETFSYLQQIQEIADAEPTPGGRLPGGDGPEEETP